MMQGPNDKQGDSAETGAGRGVGEGEEETGGVEGKARMDGQREMHQKSI